MMKPVRWIGAIAALALVVGCQESKKGGDTGGAAASGGASSTSASSGSSSTTGSTSTGASSTVSGMSGAAGAAAAGAAATLPGAPVTGITPVTGKGGLIMYDLVVGQGAEAQNGLTVAMLYTGWLTDGTRFDGSTDKPYPFVLGNGAVIQGWEEGIKGMKVGGKRKLIIPAAMGYGDRGYPGAIPPNATLVFDVELASVH